LGWKRFSSAGADGIQLMTQMKTELPHLAIIVLTMHDDPANVVRAFKAGAQAYVIKTDPPRELLQAMDAIAKGVIFLARDFAETRLSRCYMTVSRC
jgi:DNA-binding NarL/FixJ family response regulator